MFFLVKMRNVLKFLCPIFLLLGFSLNAQDFVRVNQVGYLTKSPKVALIASLNASEFQVKEAKTDKLVYSGKLGEGKFWNLSNETIQVADFSALNEEGEFYVEINGEKSYPFEIKSDGLFHDLSVWTIKAFYLWRSSIAIDSAYATFKNYNFAREIGHPDTMVFIHQSAATEKRRTESVISSPKGWYDAGDYNKYVVNAGITLHNMLLAYELFPDYYDTLKLNIPESGNEVPDLLNEIRWEVDWLLTMQDPYDGGVYHKLTTKHFCGMVQPVDDKLDRYVVKKSTAATLDFVAEMAMVSRVYKNVDKELSKKALKAAEKAWNWAKSNAAILFTNPEGIRTGSYADMNVEDEWFWAASEMFITTKEEKYFKELGFFQKFESPNWSKVNTLGLLSLRVHLDDLAECADKNVISRKFYTLVNGLYNQYKFAGGKISLKKFEWGSNGEIAEIGAILGIAYLKEKDAKFAEGMLSHFNYILGCNPTEYSFVTMFGDKYPEKLHDRRMASDNYNYPLPGYVCGGANPNQISDCGRNNYPSLAPARCYLDEQCSYSTNEIAINWNAPMVLLTGMVNNIYSAK